MQLEVLVKELPGQCARVPGRPRPHPSRLPSGEQVLVLQVLTVTRVTPVTALCPFDVSSVRVNFWLRTENEEWPEEQNRFGLGVAHIHTVPHATEKPS